MDEQNNKSKEEYDKKLAKAQKFIDILYPDYSALDPADLMKVSRNEAFIYEHTDDIEKMWEDIVAKGAQVNSKNMEYAVRTVKEMYYSKLLHPEFYQAGGEMTFEEMEQADRDERFIVNNLDLVEESFDEVKRSMRGNKDITDKEIMELAMQNSKSRRITPNQIGKRTFEVPKKAKEEARNIESQLLDKNKDQSDRGEL